MESSSSDAKSSTRSLGLGPSTGFNATPPAATLDCGASGIQPSAPLSELKPGFGGGGCSFDDGWMRTDPGTFDCRTTGWMGVRVAGFAGAAAAATAAAAVGAGGGGGGGGGRMKLLLK